MSVINGVSGAINGAYRAVLISGLTTGLAANDVVASLRWAPVAPDANKRMAILQSKLTAQIVTPFTAAQEIIFGSSVARTYTVADTGGTGNTPITGTNQTLASQNNAVSLLNDLRVCGAATLTPGTRTLDTLLFGVAVGAQLGAAASEATIPPIVAEYNVRSNQHPTPLIIAANEGLVYVNKVAFGAGGTVRFVLELEWVEFIPLSG